MIDSTMLKSDATKRDIEEVCRLAMEYKIMTVAIGASWIEYASEILKGSEVGVDAPVGFPTAILQLNRKFLKQKMSY
jgi:deoxyribose-phosphate aldolase